MPLSAPVHAQLGVPIHCAPLPPAVDLPASPSSLSSLQVVLETLTGQRAVRMRGAQTKYLVSLLRQGREEGGPGGAALGDRQA